MSELLPPNIADERFSALDQIVAERLAALPVTGLLLYVIDAAHPTALPALAWQFRALGSTWQAAGEDDAKRRECIKRVLVRRRHRGTHWAVRDALEAVGEVTHVRDGLGVPVLYDSKFTHDDVVRHDQPPATTFWVVVVADSEPSAEFAAQLRSIVTEWQRRSMRFELFWVETEELLQETLEYHRVPD